MDLNETSILLEDSAIETDHLELTISNNIQHFNVFNQYPEID